MAESEYEATDRGAPDLAGSASPASEPASPKIVLKNFWTLNVCRRARRRLEPEVVARSRAARRPRR